MVRTDRPAMTIAVDLGRKATKQLNKCSRLSTKGTTSMQVPTAAFSMSFCIPKIVT